MATRPIEFRAWDKVDNKMRRVAGIYFSQGRGQVTMEGLKSRRFTNVILMQYTGLMDKNGTKIFEGDILDTHRYGIMEVEWDEYGQWSPFGRDDHAIDGEDCRVIGNIYENPELLK